MRNLKNAASKTAFFSEAYSNKVLRTAPGNLIGYWPLGETSGSVAENLASSRRLPAAVGEAITNGVFAGSLASTGTVIGAESTTPGAVFSGNIAHVALWNTPLTAAQIAYLSRVK